MLFSVKDLYHLITNFTSKKGKVHCADKSRGTMNSTVHMSMDRKQSFHLQPRWNQHRRFNLKLWICRFNWL